MSRAKTYVNKKWYGRFKNSGKSAHRYAVNKKVDVKSGKEEWFTIKMAINSIIGELAYE